MNWRKEALRNNRMRNTHGGHLSQGFRRGRRVTPSSKPGCPPAAQASAMRIGRNFRDLY